jgi:hypothetical protein
MDGDLDLDVLVPIRGTNNWTIMWNDGAGTFSRGEAYEGGIHCHTIGAADWDGDGDIDVVSGFAQSKDMYYYECVATPAVIATAPAANATGAPVAGPLALFFNTALAPETVTAETFRVHGNQSGPHRTTIVWVPESNKVQLSLHSEFAPGEIVTVTVDGTGIVQSVDGIDHRGFAFEFMVEAAPSPATFSPITVLLPGMDPVSVAPGDFDGDGASDLVVANFLSANVTLLLTGGGNLPALTANLPTDIAPFDLWTGDIDGNGEIDIVVSNLSSSISLLLNTGGGLFQAAPAITTPGGPFGITGGDFDLDGDLDLAVCEIDPSRVRILWNDGAGGFADTASLAVGGTPLDIARADLDRDGDLDLVTADSENDQLQVFLNGLNGPESGFFSAGAFPTGDSPVNVFAWDMNGDGWIDLVSTDFENAGVSVLENTGQGALFGAPTLLPSGALPHGIFCADMTGDAAPEVTVPNSGSASLTLFQNQGGGTFGDGTSFGVGSTPYAVSGGDWNGDGTVDLVVVNRSSGDLTFLLNGQANDVGIDVSAVTGGTALLGASPNPFRESVSLHLYVASRQEVVLRVFDLRGRAVATVHDGLLPAGSHRLSWDGRDRRGSRVAAGVYFLRMDAEGRGWTRKLLHLQ